MPGMEGEFLLPSASKSVFERTEVDLGLLAIKDYVEMGVPESEDFYIAMHESFVVASIIWESLAVKDKNSIHKLFNINRERTRAIFFPRSKVLLNKIESEKDLTRINEEAIQKGKFAVFFDIREGKGLKEYEKCKPLDDFGIAEQYLKWVVGLFLKVHPVTLHYEETRVLRPTSLISCLWHQLSLALDRKINLRRCDICGQWEDMANHRSNWKAHKHCANREAVKRHRKKKKEKKDSEESKKTIV
jgi:hypothetical protein